MSVYLFDNTLKIFLIRHCESEANLDTHLLENGELDTPLTKRGEEQAVQLGKYLKKNNIIFDKVYTSSMVRAVRTSQLSMQEVDASIRISSSSEIAELSSAEYKLVLKKEGIWWLI